MSIDPSRLGPNAQRQILQKLGDLQRAREAKSKGNKYHAEPAVYYLPNGVKKKFASTKERDRFADLYLLELAGKIKDLECQVSFELIPAQEREDGSTERACSYVADFVYTETRTGKRVVEDVKGYKNASPAYKMYVIKRKLMLQKYGITVREV